MRSRCSRFVGDTPLLFHSTLSRVRTARVGDDVGGGVATGAVRFIHGTEDLSCLGDRNSDASASDEGTGVASTPSGEYMDQRTTRTSLHLCGHTLRCRGVTVVARRHRTPTQSPKRSARVTLASRFCHGRVARRVLTSSSRPGRADAVCSLLARRKGRAEDRQQAPHRRALSERAGIQHDGSEAT